VGHLQRVAYTVSGIVSVLIFIVILTQLIAPVMNIAETQMQLGPFEPAYTVIKTVSMWFMVPIFLLSLFAYLILGPAQEELQKEKRRGGL
jgi:hypothetical protein